MSAPPPVAMTAGSGLPDSGQRRDSSREVADHCALERAKMRLALARERSPRSVSGARRQHARRNRYTASQPPREARAIALLPVAMKPVRISFGAIAIPLQKLRTCSR